MAHTFKTKSPSSLTHYSFNVCALPVIYNPLLLVHLFTRSLRLPLTLLISVSSVSSVLLVLYCSSRLSISCVHLVLFNPMRPSRVVCLLRLSPASVSCCLSPASVSCVRLVLFDLIRPSRVVRLVLSVSFNILSNSNGSVVYLPIHSNALKSISLNV